MAKLIYSGFTSLDGFVADENGNFDWAELDGEVFAVRYESSRQERPATSGWVVRRSRRTPSEPAWSTNFTCSSRRSSRVAAIPTCRTRSRSSSSFSMSAGSATVSSTCSTERADVPAL